MKKTFFLLSLPLILVIAWSFASTNYFNKPLDFKLSDTARLKPEEIHAKKAILVAGLINYNHYVKKAIDDSIASSMFDMYLGALDNSKIYFLASDIKNFEKYRYELDNLLQKGNVDIAYEIFNLYRERVLQRIDKIIQTLDKENDDFTIDEFLEMDREKISWAKSEKELDDFWRKFTKNQVLSLKLNGKDTKEAKEIIKIRNERFKKSMNQSKSEDVFQIYMNALTGAYDPHSNYFSPVSSQNFNMQIQKSFEGIGARLQTQNDYTVISEVMPGGPAFKGKELKANDKIIGVAQGDKDNFTDVIGWRLDDVVSLIRGAKGTVVRLQIIPANSGVNAVPVVVRLVRDRIKIEDESAEKKIIPITQNNKTYKLGLISVPSFYLDFEAYRKGIKDYKSTSNDVRKLIQELKAENIDGLIVDLRNNGGGSLKEAIDLTGLFIKEGPIVQVRNADGSVDVGNDTDPEQVYEGPLLVMVNGFSASASEIFAGAIQDYKRGIIVGEATYGKGTVQNAIDLNRYLPDVSDRLGQLNITLSKYYRVTGSSTQHLGVNPDIKMPSLYSQNEIGESSEPKALPWDEIKAARFKAVNNVSDALILKLEKSYMNRMKTDPELKKLISDIQELKELRKNTKISLQEEKRKKEQEIYKQKQAERVDLENSEEENEGEIKKDDKIKTDPYLKNATQILLEMINEKQG